MAILAALALTLGHATAALAETVSVLVAYHSVTGNTEKMARGVAEGVKTVPGANAVAKRVGEVTADHLLSSDGVIIGSLVYFGNMAGEVKTFWTVGRKWAVPRSQDAEQSRRAFATGGSVSSGKELTMLTIEAAMLMHQMLVTSGGGGFGASATTEPDSPGINEKELAEANALDKRIAEVAMIVKRGSNK